MSILDAIGQTRLVPLRHIAPQGGARILIKLEYENPTGSMKDRMANAMIQAAEADGRLRPGGSVVEYTGGSTGVSLAFVCAVKGIPLQIVTSEVFSREKRDHMTALGARLTLVPSASGGTTKALTLEMIETARKLAAAPGSFWTDQLNNSDQLSCYDAMGQELWEQSGGEISAFVQSVGTAGSLRGISTQLRTRDPAVRIVAVEPEESPVLSGGQSGSHKIEGVGAGFVVPLWQEGIADEIQTVSTPEAMATARTLARREGLFAGTSTGANVAVALRVAKRLGPHQTVVTLAVDSGLKYLSTPLYSGSTPPLLNKNATHESARAPTLPINPPPGYPRISPYLNYEDTEAMLDWLARAFGLNERHSQRGPDGKVMHAEMALEDGVVMMGTPGGDFRNPRRLGQVTQSLYVYIDDLDTHCARAREAGAEIIEEPANQPYGDRRYGARDPEGHRWYFASRFDMT